MLKLTDRDSGEERQVRTDGDGNFAFGVDVDHGYKIASGAKSYAVDTPKRLVKGGDEFEVRLKQL